MYKSDIKKKYLNNPIWDYLYFDREGDLWLDKLCLMDLPLKFGSPLEIIYLPLIKSRGDLFKETVKHTAKKLKYPGKFQFFFATKANMRPEVISAVDEAKWNVETSSNQDLVNLKSLKDEGRLNNNNLIICNGIKGVLDNDIRTDRQPKSRNVNYIKKVSPQFFNINDYADNILKFHTDGMNILPILDSGEAEYFLNKEIKRILPVGLRLKFGKVSSKYLVNDIESRHGMKWNEIKRIARLIKNYPKLELTMLHAMAGVSADKMAEKTLAQSLLVAAEYYFLLKRQNPTLATLNIGGGIPPFHKGFSVEQFLNYFLPALMQKAKKYKMDLPIIAFELGTYLVDEAGFYIYKVIQKKDIVTKNGKSKGDWAIVDSGIMADLPDSLFVNKSYIFLALNMANYPSVVARIGDITCDSDGIYPHSKIKENHLLIPKSQKVQYLLVVGTGAYQKILSGVGGAHHCGIPNPNRLIIDKNKGKITVTLSESQTTEQYKKILGY